MSMDFKDTVFHDAVSFPCTKLPRKSIVDDTEETREGVRRFRNFETVYESDIDTFVSTACSCLYTYKVGIHSNLPLYQLKQTKVH